MIAKNGHIRYVIAVSIGFLLAFSAVAEAEKLAGGNSGSSRQSSLASKNRLTPYEILRRSKLQQAVEIKPENFSVGPVVATATLKIVPISRDSPTHYLGMQRQDTTTERPPELHEQPADAPKEPVYFVVSVGDRDIHGITYRSISSSKPVKLYLDTDGDGLFSDEKEYVGTWLSIFQLTRTYQFGPVSTQQADTGTKGGSFYADCSNGQWLTFDPAFYRQGKVVLDGRTYEIALVDTDFDGKYNKYFVPPAGDSRDPRCDVLAIDLDGDSKFDFERPGISEIMPLSRLIEINGRYYSMDVADDGGTIEFRQARPQFGTLSLEGKQVKLALWSDAARLELSGSGQNWNLPAGKYSVVELELTERDSDGNRWTFDTIKARAWQGRLGDFEIRPGQTTSFDIGPPFKIRTFMKDSGQNALVGFYLEGQAGELYVPGAKKNSVEVPEPQFKIIAASGQTVYSGQFEFR
ncbi:MAG: hypothetical protein A2168_00910 [Planctomycetes bacterium RBG_13_50_24]|nr:MAG: hypothetical protein A2168_00910 [Planctomycetes bacterium RBG_13_50_24]